MVSILATPWTKGGENEISGLPVGNIRDIIMVLNYYGFQFMKDINFNSSNGYYKTGK